jgi:membrane fusion protein (multidrug efflux system)
MLTDTGNEKKVNDVKEKQPVAKKSHLGLIAGVLVLLVLAGGAFSLYSESLKYESTDDAQIDGHLNPISTRVAGTIKAVHVEDNQHVEAGAPLFDLDTRDFEVSLAQTKAQYAQALAQLRGEQPNLPITVTSNLTDAATARAQLINADAGVAAAEHDYAAALQQLAQAEANNAKAQSDLRRYRQLLDKQEVAQSEYDQYESAAKAQAAMVAAQKETVASQAKIIEQRKAQVSEKQYSLDQTLTNGPRQVLIRNASIEARAAGLESIKAQIAQDELNIEYCHVVAPVAGLVSQRSAEVGSRVSTGQQLMMLVQTGDIWVTANFKETQLKKMRKGQHASVAIDALDKTFDGYVESMPAATGDRTSALPPENATGNYVKVVQRLPVRIRLKAGQPGLSDLRSGMSAEPKVYLQ